MKATTALGAIIDVIGRPRHPHDPRLLDFEVLNVAQIARNLRLEERGGERGALGEPDTNSTVFDQVESSIISQIETTKTLAHGKFIDNMQTLNQRLASLDLLLFISRIKEAVLSARDDFTTTTHLGRDELFLSKKKLIETEHELQTFRQHHGLNRPARIPASRVLQVGLVFLLFAIESLLNGGFLGAGHAFGLLGGYVEAVGFAFLNVGLAFWIGWKVLGYLSHRSLFLRVAAVAILAIGLGIACALNLAFAHYRDVLLQTMTDDAARIVIARLTGDPLAIIDFKSWILFLLATLFWMMALFDGYKMDDPYPGYGEIFRRYSDVVHEYADVKSHLYEELNGYLDDNAKAIELAKKELESRRHESMAITTSRVRLRNGYDAHLTHLQQACNELLSIYRDTNRRARSSADQSPSPARFDVPWQIVAPVVDDVSATKSGEPNVQVADAVRELDGLVQQVYQSCEDAKRSFDSIDLVTSQEDLARVAPAHS